MVGNALARHQFPEFLAYSAEVAFGYEGWKFQIDMLLLFSAPSASLRWALLCPRRAHGLDVLDGHG